MENVERLKDSDPVDVIFHLLPPRARHVIFNNRIGTVGELRGLKDSDILGWPNSGRHTLQDIRTVLGQWNGLEISLRLALKEMDRLTDEQRVAVMAHYCRSCGAKDPSCQCWNDE